MKTTTCAVCGIEFGLPDAYMTKLYETGQGFKCPNGHSLVFSPSQVEKLKKQVAEQQGAIDYLRGVIEGLREERMFFVRRAAGYKSQFSRLKKLSKK